jgi:metal-responsive CopG/Arc/MetJ family transcriptional regulator
MGKKKIYRRTQIYLNEHQYKNLDKDSQKINITRSELIRRILDKFYEELPTKK